MQEEINCKSGIYEVMIARIERTAKISNYLLIYYSVILIMFSLLTVFFQKAISPQLISFFNLLISIVMLVFTVINNLADYQKRIQKIQISKAELDDLLIRCGDCIDTPEIRLKYNEIVRNTERETKVDIQKAENKKISISAFYINLVYVMLIIVPWVILMKCIYTPNLKYYFNPNYWN